MQISEKNALQFISLLTEENEKLKEKIEKYRSNGMYDYYEKQLDDATSKIVEKDDTIKHLRKELSDVYDRMQKLENELEYLKSNDK